MALRRRTIDMIGVDCRAEICRRDVSGGQTQKDFREAPCAAARLEDVNRLPFAQPAAYSLAEASPQAIARDRGLRVGVELRQTECVPLLAKRVRVLGFGRDNTRNVPAYLE